MQNMKHEHQGVCKIQKNPFDPFRLHIEFPPSFPVFDRTMYILVLNFKVQIHSFVMTTAMDYGLWIHDG